MSALNLLASLLTAALAGSLLGFLAGLIPGLHMNNIAAAIGAYAAAAIGVFTAFRDFVGGGDPYLMISCFISAAMLGHLFGETVTSTYVGIPSEDVVSVLPAHRLAKAGLGIRAVQSSADGCFAGAVIGIASILPICMIMGSPVGLYSVLRAIMLPIILFFSAILLVSEGFPSLRLGHHTLRPLMAVLKATAVFFSAGALGYLVFDTNFYACRIPDVPWNGAGFVSRSSLLLPLFAGLFGAPGLLLSLSSRSVPDIAIEPSSPMRNGAGIWRACLSLAGGTIVGWLPGMTSGSAVTLCAPTLREAESLDDIEGSLRFIWLYSSVSSCGAVMSVGALFVISRARSGSMDAVAYFIGNGIMDEPLEMNLAPLASILLAMLVSALLCRWLLVFARSPLRKMRSILCSRQLALGSLAFVAALSVALTGSRGAMLMAAATSLGLVAPLIGVRRIQLMGCLMVPIAILFLRQM